MAGEANVVVDWAMRYGNPSIAERTAELQAQGCERILCFPLYPQYSASTTATVNDKFFEYLSAQRWMPAVRTVPAYHDEPVYIDALARSKVPTTVIWGLNDTVSPPRVASWVWDRKLMLKPGRNALYYIPDAGHYLQEDRPDALVDAALHALDATGEEEPGAIAVESGSPVLVDHSRERIPSAPEVLPAGD